MGTVRSYSKATYGREFKAAYRYISPADQKVHAEESYSESQGSYQGFTLEVAKVLANFMDIGSIQRAALDDHLWLRIGYRVPAPAKLGALLFNWNQDKLNALPPGPTKTNPRGDRKA